ncbi:hypothetical protein [Maliponia aquimaris]|uniref:hypothetical protein n=1 Tax=Maliponia aquimaris TaxID=1673631 RepID=UPI001595D747|nr:hypothetical protein [Maliponia aquimaris]
MALLISALLFAGFVGDVVLGALTGKPVLSDVQSMLMLFGASIAFVVAILRRERLAKK